MRILSSGHDDYKTWLSLSLLAVSGGVDVISKYSEIKNKTP